VYQIAPYANFVLGLLKTVLPVARPAIDVHLGADTAASWKIEDHLEAMKEWSKTLPDEAKVPQRPDVRRGILSEVERSGLPAMHALLRELDPHHEKLGLTRVPTYTGDYRWLCRTHYQDWEPNIPEEIELGSS
jgi:hypothetical protein